MIRAVLQLSLRYRYTVLVMAIVVIAAGLYNAWLLPIDAVPDITNRQVQINAMAPAMSAEETERRITFPLEVAMGGLPHLTEVRSVSQFGLSQVTLVFEDQVNIYFARQLVSERLGEAKDQLPAGVQVSLSPVSTGLGEILYVKLENDQLDLMERRSLMDWTVRPALRTVPGVAEVNVWGGVVRQYQVLIDPDRLQGYGFTVRDVVTAVANNNANAGGAFIERGSEQQVVRTLGLITNPGDIESIVVGQREGVPITVRQVGRVETAGAVRQGAMTDPEGEQVYAITMLLIGENGRVVVERVKAKLAEISKSLPAGTRLEPFMDRSQLIGRTLQTAVRNLVEGGALVIVTLFLFLLQLRAGLIVSAAIPFSMLVAIMGMRYFDVSANLMSLGAVDFGLIVDGAVIIVENCVRQLALRRERLDRDLTEAERQDTILEATSQVRQSTQFGEFIILCAYVPILCLQGLEGKMFRPMGLTVIMALSAAMLASFTLIPALCSVFLKERRETRHVPLEWLSRKYEVVLGWSWSWRRVITALAVVLVALCLALIPRLGSEFIPELDEGALAIQATYLPSISLTEVTKRTETLEKLLLHDFPDDVEQVVARIGRAEIATDPMLVNQVDFLVSLKPRRARSREQLVEQMARTLKHMPGVSLSFSQPIKMRMMELIEGSGIRADLGIKLFGPDREVLAQQAERIAAVVRTVPGAKDVQVETTQGLPQLQIKIRRNEIARFGINVSDINQVVEAALGGVAVTQVSDGSQRLDVAVRLPERFRNDALVIARLMIPTPSGSMIPLGELADLESLEGPVQISREGGRRRVVIQSNVRGRDLGRFVQEVQARLDAEVKLPAGYYPEYGGTYRNLSEGRARMMVVVPLTMLLIFGMLFLTFHRFRQAVLVFTGIPFAATGGVLALALRGMPLSISAGIGFIALMGVAVLNGVVLVTYIDQLRGAGLSWGDAVIRGATARLRPVLMTATVAGLGFVPMALSQGAGAEVQRPLATVVIGGLVSSTLLTLVLLPTLMRWLEERTSERPPQESALPTAI